MKNMIFILLGLCFFIGCSPDEWIAEIKSDTKWKAEFESDGSIYRTEEGSGNTTYSLADDRKICLTVWKLTEEGYIKLKIIDETVTWRTGDSKELETTHPYGGVKVCTQF